MNCEVIMSNENKIRDAANAVKGIVEAVPIYQDALQPAAREIGTTLQTIAKAIHIAILPLRLAVWGYDQIEEWLLPRLAEKLRHCPEERITTPNAIVAGPALEALRFAGQEPTLRELYANLLATSIDADKAQEVHPSFVDIIRQLTPDEALLFKFISETFEGAFPVPTISARVIVHSQDGKSFWHDIRNYSRLIDDAGCKFPQLIPGYLDNLCRLGLLSNLPLSAATEYLGVPQDQLYEMLENSPKVLGEWLPSGTKINKTITHFNRNVIQLTGLGRQFNSACITGSFIRRSPAGGTTWRLELKVPQS
ncbi:Abi-alpha family protein [Thermodesulfobacteriota bacterium]